jgi:hypothetical protein
MMLLSNFSRDPATDYLALNPLVGASVIPT